MSKQKTFITVFCVVTVILLLPILCYAYGTVFLGGGLFNDEQKQIAFAMAEVWTAFLIMAAPIALYLFM